MKTDHLIIFIKNPILGKTKTRLAEAIGDGKALEVYLHLLDMTRETVRKVDAVRNLFYAEFIDTSDDWDGDLFNKFVQEGDGLGQRMNNAFMQIFALGAQKAIIVGSDCPELTTELIATAFAKLDEKDLVIGPAKDGGYYLLGMKKHIPVLFEDKEWSTDTVYEDTIIDLMENRLSYHALPKLSDVDTIYDLKLLKGRFGT